MATEQEFLCHGWVIVGTLINDTPANICVDLALAGSEGTSPVDFLTITTRADLTVPVLGWE